MKKFLSNFRKTSAYKWISYASFIEVICLSLTFILKGDPLFIGIYLYFLPLIAFVIFFFIGIILIMIEIKSPKGNPNILYDIGFLISLFIICYFIFFFLMISKESRQISPSLEKTKQIDKALYSMEKNCDDKIDDFASCFAKYFNEYEKISSVENNVIITQNNEKYTFHINHNCKDKANYNHEDEDCYIDISNGNDIEKPYMRVFVYHYPISPYDSWLTHFDYIEFE